MAKTKTTSVYLIRDGAPGTYVMILKIFPPKNLAKKLVFFCSKLLVVSIKIDHNIVFF
jgi:hypothetical protein